MPDCKTSTVRYRCVSGVALKYLMFQRHLLLINSVRKARARASQDIIFWRTDCVWSQVVWSQNVRVYYRRTSTRLSFEGNLPRRLRTSQRCRAQSRSLARSAVLFHIRMSDISFLSRRDTVFSSNLQTSLSDRDEWHRSHRMLYATETY